MIALCCCWLATELLNIFPDLPRLPHRPSTSRFGNSLEALEEVARIACEMAPRPSSSLASRAIKTIGLVRGRPTAVLGTMITAW